MASFELNNYITRRYESWLDYARYHCGRLGMKDEAEDVLNEVLCSLLEKEEGRLLGMLRCGKDGCTGLDWFVLGMLKRNVVSETSPYRQKRVCRKVDRKVDVHALELRDEETGDEEDVSERVLRRMRSIRDVVDGLGLTEREKEIFYYRFFCGNSFADWPGSEGRKKLYDVYNQIIRLVKGKLKGGV